VSENAEDKPLARSLDHRDSGQTQGTAMKALTVQEIRTWLISRIAERTGTEPQEIGVWEPFTVFGLVSKDAVGIAAELEDWLGRRFSPNLLYDYPSIGVLTQHLTAQPGDVDAGRASSGPTLAADALGEILARLDLLSEAEAESLLEKRARIQEPQGEKLR